MEKSSSPKPFIVGFNVIIQILLVVALLVFINLAVNRWHPPKIDLSRSNYYKLSDKTIQLLKNLKAPTEVEVVVFFQRDASDPIVSKVFDDVQNLLEEYKSTCPQLKVKYVDPDRDLTNAEKLATEYNVKVPNVVVFSCEKRNKFVQVSDLVEFDRAGNPFGGGGSRIKAFKGEQQFTSAIQNVLDAKQLKIYFLDGHGEGDPMDVDPRKGYSNIVTYIGRDNLLVGKLSIFEKQQIPKDCDVLIICGPVKPFSDVEFKAIQDYLNQNGRLMVLLDGLHNESGLDKFLLDYGVKVGNDIVLVKIRDRLGGEALVTSAPGTFYGKHQITETFRKANVATLFPGARSVDRMSSGSFSKNRVTVLVETPGVESIWAETDLVKLQQEKAQFDDKDRKSPVPLAVAVEPTAVGEMEREGMRLVVFGSSMFIRNGNLKGGNVDLLMNSLNWLLKRQHLMGIASKVPEEFALMLDVFQSRAIFVTEVIAIPLSVLVIGLLVRLRRRA